MKRKKKNLTELVKPKARLLFNYLTHYDHHCILRHKEVKLLCFFLLQSAAVTIKEIAGANLVDRASIGKYLSSMRRIGLVLLVPDTSPKAYTISDDGLKYLDNLTKNTDEH